MLLQEIELFGEDDWNEADRNLFLRRKFNLLTYQQISETKIGDLRNSDRTQNLILGVLDSPDADSKIGDLNSFYAIGELQNQQISASKVALYNQTLLSMIKNRYSSNLLKKYKRINNMGRQTGPLSPRTTLGGGNGPLLPQFPRELEGAVQ